MALIQGRKGEIKGQKKRVKDPSKHSAHTHFQSASPEKRAHSSGYVLAQPFAFTERTLSLVSQILNLTLSSRVTLEES